MTYIILSLVLMFSIGPEGSVDPLQNKFAVDTPTWQLVPGFIAGSGTAAKDDSTYTGGTGSKAYTVGDIVKALKDLGLMAPS